MPRRSEASISLDRRTQPGESLTQVLVLDVRQRLGDLGRQHGIGSRWHHLLAMLEGSLAQGNSPDCLPTEETIDPLEDDAREMLYFERRRAFNAKHQGGGFRRLFAERAWPIDFKRLAMSGDLGSDDIPPARNDFG